MTRARFDLQVGYVFIDQQAAGNGKRREVTVQAVSESGEYAFVLASPSGRRTRIHRDTLRLRFVRKR